ncbi:MAG: methionine--tRNA ligase subunit beta [Candidatus Paceibacterota bacterium]
MINIDDFLKVELKVGKILTVEKVEDADKLLKLSVSFGEIKKVEKDEEGNEIETVSEDVRQIVSGIALYFEDYSVLVNKKVMFVTNLAPRSIRGLESNGMILAVSSSDGSFSLLYPDQNIQEGIKAK